MEKSSKMNVAGMERICPIETRDLSSLRLDQDNPRFLHLNEVLTDKDLEKKIWEEKDTKDLYRAIIAAKGLTFQPYIMNDGRVREGNRRVVCLRKIVADIKEKKLNLPINNFQNVECIVFPDDMPEKEIKLFLGRSHVTGKKEWNAINQAGYIYELNNSLGVSFEEIREHLSMSKGKVLQRFWAYEKTCEFMNKFPERTKLTDYSYFEEAYKKKTVREWLEASSKNMDRFHKWVLNKKFDGLGPVDIRRLAKFIDDERMLKVLDDEGISKVEKELMNTSPGSFSQTFKIIEKAIDALKYIPRNEYNSIPQNKAKTEMLRELKKEIEKIFMERGVK